MSNHLDTIAERIEAQDNGDASSDVQTIKQRITKATPPPVLPPVQRKPVIVSATPDLTNEQIQALFDNPDIDGIVSPDMLAQIRSGKINSKQLMDILSQPQETKQDENDFLSGLKQIGSSMLEGIEWYNDNINKPIAEFASLSLNPRLGLLEAVEVAGTFNIQEAAKNLREHRDERASWFVGEKLLGEILFDPLNTFGWGLYGKVPLLGFAEAQFIKTSLLPAKALKGAKTRLFGKFGLSTGAKIEREAIITGASWRSLVPTAEQALDTPDTATRILQSIFGRHQQRELLNPQEAHILDVIEKVRDASPKLFPAFEKELLSSNPTQVADLLVSETRKLAKVSVQREIRAARNVNNWTSKWYSIVDPIVGIYQQRVERFWRMLNRSVLIGVEYMPFNIAEEAGTHFLYVGSFGRQRLDMFRVAVSDLNVNIPTILTEEASVSLAATLGKDLDKLTVLDYFGKGAAEWIEKYNFDVGNLISSEIQRSGLLEGARSIWELEYRTLLNLTPDDLLPYQMLQTLPESLRPMRDDILPFIGAMVLKRDAAGIRSMPNIMSLSNLNSNTSRKLLSQHGTDLPPNVRQTFIDASDKAVVDWDPVFQEMRDGVTSHIRQQPENAKMLLEDIGRRIDAGEVINYRDILHATIFREDVYHWNWRNAFIDRRWMKRPKTIQDNFDTTLRDMRQYLDDTDDLVAKLETYMDDLSDEALIAQGVDPGATKGMMRLEIRSWRNIRTGEQKHLDKWFTGDMKPRRPMSSEEWREFYTEKLRIFESERIRMTAAMEKKYGFVFPDDEIKIAMSGNKMADMLQGNIENLRRAVDEDILGAQLKRSKVLDQDLNDYLEKLARAIERAGPERNQQIKTTYEMAMNKAVDSMTDFFTDFSLRNETVADAFMRAPLPFWRYEWQRPFRALTFGLSRPAVGALLAPDAGKLWEYTDDRGRWDIPGLPFKFSPFAGSVARYPVTITRHVFQPELQGALGGSQLALDWAGRYGFVPGPGLSAPYELGLTLATGKPNNLRDSLPPIATAALTAPHIVSGIINDVLERVNDDIAIDPLLTLSDKLNDATFLVTNLGVLGSEWFDTKVRYRLIDAHGITPEDATPEQLRDAKEYVTKIGVPEALIGSFTYRPDAISDTRRQINEAYVKELNELGHEINLEELEAILATGESPMERFAVPRDVRERLFGADALRAYLDRINDLRPEHIQLIVKARSDYFDMVDQIEAWQLEQQTELDIELENGQMSKISWRDGLRELARQAFNQREIAQRVIEQRIGIDIPLTVAEVAAFKLQNKAPIPLDHPQDVVAQLYWSVNPDNFIDPVTGDTDWGRFYSVRASLLAATPEKWREAILERILKNETPNARAFREGSITFASDFLNWRIGIVDWLTRERGIPRAVAQQIIDDSKVATTKARQAVMAGASPAKWDMLITRVRKWRQAYQQWLRSRDSQLDAWARSFYDERP